jgi:hypothetical protein
MIRITTLLLTASLSLIMSPMAVQADPATKIFTLPCVITVPGNYVLASNLFFSGPMYSTAITISPTINGPVIIDLKGFTIDGGDLPGGGGNYVTLFKMEGTASTPANNSSRAIPPNAPGRNLYPVTIRNGRVQGFQNAFWFEACKDITINNIYFNYGVQGVEFLYVDSSSVNNCNFDHTYIGITDDDSNGGNGFHNDIFNDNLYQYYMEGVNGTTDTVLKMHLQFDPPAPVPSSSQLN